jgi:hypothetical protein
MTTYHHTRLQKRDPKRNQYRYYSLDLQPHLFGGWSLSSTFALFELGKSGLSWCNSTRRSGTQLTATMKGSGYEGTRFCHIPSDLVVDQ